MIIVPLLKLVEVDVAVYVFEVDVAVYVCTFNNASIVDTGKTDRNDVPIVKPSAIRSYNLHMGGVDRVDQQLHGIQSLRKTYKWYKKLAFRLILQCSLNAHKIHDKYVNGNASFLNLLSNIKLVFSLKPVVIRNPRIVPGEDVERLTGRHFPSQVPTEIETNQRPHKRCRVCFKRKKLTAKGHPLKTVFIYRFCPSQPGLHLDECFEAYHTLLDYSDGH